MARFRPVVARWLPLLHATSRSPLPRCAVVGLVAAQMALNVTPEASIRAASAVGFRASLACWAALTVVEVAFAVLRGSASGPRGMEQMAGQAAASSSVVIAAGGLRWPVALPRLAALHVTLATAALIAAALHRVPSRVVANLLGYGLVAAPLLWVVQRRAGPPAATKAAVLLAIFALFSTQVDIRNPPVTEEWRADSQFLWAAGWPHEEWRLRHEIQLDRPAAPRPLRLLVLLARAYAGPAQMFAALNGQELGPLRRAERDEIDERVLQLDIPGHLIAGQSRLTFEFRQYPGDPDLRIVAQRWASGATLGSAASSYYDTERWWSGTFNDLARRRQAGIYVVELRGAP